MLFSFPVMCMFLLIGSIYFFCVRAIAEPDIWWHLRNAAYVFEHHSFPVVDTYSFGAAGSPWLDHEWLSEIPLYLGFKAMGLRGMLAVYFAVVSLIFCGVYYRACRAGAECKDAAARYIAGDLSRHRVDRSASVALRLALHGWAVARNRPFSAKRQRPLDVAASVCAMDQPARFLGLRHDSPGDRHRVGIRGGRVGTGRGAALDSRRAERNCWRRWQSPSPPCS